MSAGLQIDVEWLSADHETPELRQTSARLKISLAPDLPLTRSWDEWSRTTQDAVRLSAYPLALWFAVNWWRLRWEPLPPAAAPATSWRMSHELAAAGHGYIWPSVLFASDAENIQIWAAQSGLHTKAPVRYLTDAYAAISGASFERAVDEFVQSVLARLDAVNIHDTGLHTSWAEVTRERRDGAMASHRRLEALLGFDPDDCPEELIGRFNALNGRIGAGAAGEIAIVCASADPGAILANVLSFAEEVGIEGRVGLTLPGTGNWRGMSTQVWERGYDLAHRARDAAGLNGAAVGNQALCEILGIKQDEAFETISQARLPLGIAIRGERTGAVKFLPRKRHLAARRFELARFLCDYLVADERDAWLPASDAKTARQKTQRAFAAEFLCPIGSLINFLAEDFSPDAIDEAAEHFQVAEMAVRSQLVNHHYLQPEAVESAAGNTFSFPYVTRAAVQKKGGV